MIQVQIASQLSALGVEGVRWVLVDPCDAAISAAPTPAAVVTAADAKLGDPADEGSLLSMALLKLLLTGLALGAALWAAQVWLGKPCAAALAPPVQPATKSVTPAVTLPSTLGPTSATAPVSPPVTTPDSTPAEAIPMPNPLLMAPLEASPVTVRDAVHGAPVRVTLPMSPALPGMAASAPVFGPLLTAELR